MSKYRKKPIEIEACQMGTDDSYYGAAPQWVLIAIKADRVKLTPDGFEVKTDEGTMIGVGGDYLIRGVEGELYPCRLSVFQATYEPVE